jgi:cytoplasmic iron level regulating protein YaaA (DUF328/UPF0246 family)
VLVLLPPSEGKTVPSPRARPLELASLTFAELTPQRAAILDALEALCAGPAGGDPDGGSEDGAGQDGTRAALSALGLSAGQTSWVAHDAALRRAGTARASAVYTGVLYERLGLADLPLRARRRVLIFSALWGVVAPDDRIPAYKLSMGARLPGFRGLAATWKPALREVLPSSGLVLDLRSGSYAAAWTPPPEAEVVVVRGFTEAPDGTRKTVSHMVKATRGEVAQIALKAPRTPRSAPDVAELVAAAGHRVELAETRAGWVLDVVES